MSLSYEDLQAIRKVVEEAIHPVRGDIEALTNDVKEIYDRKMIGSSPESVYEVL